MVIKKPDIFEYINYRLYLKDLYAYLKKETPGLNHLAINRQLGGSKNLLSDNKGSGVSRSYFSNILSGKTNIGGDKIDAFTKIFKLKNIEKKYFRTMVLYNQAKTDDDRDYFFQQIAILNKTPQKIVTIDQCDYYSSWYHSVIRAVLDLIDFKDDYQKLAKMIIPSITVKQAKESIRLLTRLKLVDKNEKGYFKPTNTAIIHDPKVSKTLINQYQLSTFNHIMKILSIDENKRDDKDFRCNTMTVSASQKGIEKISQKLMETRNEIRSIVAQDILPAEKVFQVNLTYFAMTKGKN